MKLTGLAAKVFGFESREPEGPSLISRPFNPSVSTNHALGPLQELRTLRRPLIEEEHVFLDVPFVHQQHVNLCGDACVSMLLGYLGRPQPDLSKNPRGLLKGLSTSGYVSLFQQNGVEPVRVQWPLPLPRQKGDLPAWTTESLCAALRKHGPILCKGRLPNDVVGHSIVLVGASDGRVAFHDPWSGPRQTCSLDEFNAFLRWGDDTMIACRVKRFPESMDETALGTAPRE